MTTTDWKLEPPPPSSHSGPQDTRPFRWWFVRVQGIKDYRSYQHAREWLKLAGAIKEFGYELPFWPDCGWVLLRSRCSTIEELRSRFGANSKLVGHIEALTHRTEAIALVRQAPLFA